MKVRHLKRAKYLQHAYICVMAWWIGDHGCGATTDKNWGRHRHRPGIPRLKPSPMRYRRPWEKAHHKAFKEGKA
jgi:hypothetical protein